MDKHPVANHIQSHRSTRKFKNTRIPEEIIKEIITSAQWAPTSHNVQAYSIISITDQTLRVELAHLCGDQKYVKEAPAFFVFTADFYPHSLISRRLEVPFEMEETENVIVGAVDTALAAQNALLTARAYGLGGVMIGGIRNHSEKVAKLLKLPEWTFPVMGLCLGYPASITDQKPRFPLYGVLHENHYDANDIEKAIVEYDERTLHYYSNRKPNPKQSGWSSQMAAYLSTPRRPGVTAFLKKQGFKMK
ncbi:oxygen-insensitive NADPH nitroreductase [Alteribacillus sp. HJP-4]|uniref:oxygen-insensitive NADPH nitroreductase n=1 Tax=Alteribacillus sp. HJP-4 TaxID=2775394 RepID=UPI0035CCD484